MRTPASEEIDPVILMQLHECLFPVFCSAVPKAVATRLSDAILGANFLYFDFK